MLTLKISQPLVSLQLNLSKNAHPQNIPAQVKMLTLKISQHLASLQLDTSQNAHPQDIPTPGVTAVRQNTHPQNIPTLGVSPARYESKCSPSKYPNTWCFCSLTQVKMLTHKISNTWCLCSLTRVKMLTSNVFRYFASLQLNTVLHKDWLVPCYVFWVWANCIYSWIEDPGNCCVNCPSGSFNAPPKSKKWNDCTL